MNASDALVGVRADVRARVAAVVLGVVVGVLLGEVHWLGIFVGGAVAGLGQRSPGRGVGAGLLAGAGVWVVFVAVLAWEGRASPVVASGLLTAVSLAIAVIYGALGGLLRGVA